MYLRGQRWRCPKSSVPPNSIIAIACVAGARTFISKRLQRLLRRLSSPSLYVCYVIALLAPWIKYSNSLRNVLLGSNSGLGTFAALQSVYVLVKFCRWFKFSFLLFQTTIPPKQRKIKFEPRIKLIHNIYLWFKTSKTTFGQLIWQGGTFDPVLSFVSGFFPVAAFL